MGVVSKIKGLFKPIVANAGRITTTELVNKCFLFCELYSGKKMFPYQEQFSKRVIRSVIENDGDEITALFSRQSGKSETIALTVGGLMILLPILANMPMFADDPRLAMFKDGLWVGIFAPSQRQASITYNRIKSRIQCATAVAVLESPEFNLTFTTSNGQTVALSNGSFATAISASDGSNIEGESFKFIICEEAQDISNYKIRKSIHPMGAAYNATIAKIGTATTFKGDFYEAIQRNKRADAEKSSHRKNHFEYPWQVAAKYNPKYLKYVEKEKKRLGENSDEFQMSYCVTPETRILTSDLRWVRADSIKPGDKLIGFDENPPGKYGQRKFKESVVEDAGRITRPCYRITLSDGTTVSCSSEHQWLVFTAGSRTQWKKTEDLVSTDRIYRVCPTWDDLPTDYRLGYLSAAFDGEGCATQVNGILNQIVFAQRDNSMLSQVKEYLTDFGFDFNLSYSDSEKVRNGQDPVYKLFLRGGRRELIRFLGSVRPKRLLSNFDPNSLGTVRCSNGSSGKYLHPSVSKLEYIGEQTVIPIRTSTRTYIAEGLASHNCLKWIIERGMFIDYSVFEVNNLETSLERCQSDHTSTHVAGIDLGGKGDDTIITVVEVNWDIPVILEKRVDDETQEEEVYEAYDTYIKDWHCISGVPDYEEQYYMIVDYLSYFSLARVVCDATREASVSHRLRANLKCEVIPFIFTQKSKSDLYKNLSKEIASKRAKVCAGPLTVETREFKNFVEQLCDLQKGYSGSNLVVSHPDEKNAHDDYPDSWALAVWGCSSKGYVDNTETKDDPFRKREQRINKTRNRYTARRRR